LNFYLLKKRHRVALVCAIDKQGARYLFPWNEGQANDDVTAQILHDQCDEGVYLSNPCYLDVLSDRRKNITDQFKWKGNTVFMTTSFDEVNCVREVFVSGSKSHTDLGKSFMDTGLIISRSLRSCTIEELATHFHFESQLDCAGKIDKDNETILTVVIQRLAVIDKEFRQ